MVNFNLIYCIGSENYGDSFFRIPKILFYDDYFRTLSTDAKMLYALMLDKVSLSYKNGFIDECKRVYIYYTLQNVMSDLQCSKNKALKVMDELGPNGFSLIESKRQGLGKPNIIFVKQIHVPDTQSEQAPDVAVQQCGYKKCTSASSNEQLQEAQNKASINNNYNKTNQNGVYSINPSNITDVPKVIDRSIDITATIKEMLDYDSYVGCGWQYEKMYLSLFQIVYDIITVPRNNIKIGGSIYPYSVVKSRFFKLTGSHLEYIIECLNESKVQIRNMYGYMLTSLYNSVSTLDTYYAANVHYMLYGNIDKPDYKKIGA